MEISLRYVLYLYGYMNINEYISVWSQILGKVQLLLSLT